MRTIFLAIHDVRSIHNVASMFRTADGCGVSKIFLTGYTPGPIDRFGRVVRAFGKVSLGAEANVPWERRDIHELIKSCKTRNIPIVALEQAPTARSLDEYPVPQTVLLVVGNEVGGVPEDVLSVVDAILEIPMRGSKESLNVAVATGIALYTLSTKQHQ